MIDQFFTEVGGPDRDWQNNIYDVIEDNLIEVHITEEWQLK